MLCLRLVICKRVNRHVCTFLHVYLHERVSDVGNVIQHCRLVDRFTRT